MYSLTRKEKLVERIKKNITKFDMKAEDFGFATHSLAGAKKR